MSTRLHLSLVGRHRSTGEPFTRTSRRLTGWPAFIRLSAYSTRYNRSKWAVPWPSAHLCPRRRQNPGWVIFNDTLTWLTRPTGRLLEILVAVCKRPMKARGGIVAWAKVAGDGGASRAKVELVLSCNPGKIASAQASFFSTLTCSKQARTPIKLDLSSRVAMKPAAVMIIMVARLLLEDVVLERRAHWSRELMPIERNLARRPREKDQMCTVGDNRRPQASIELYMFK